MGVIYGRKRLLLENKETPTQNKTPRQAAIQG